MGRGRLNAVPLPIFDITLCFIERMRLYRKLYFVISESYPFHMMYISILLTPNYSRGFSKIPLLFIILFHTIYNFFYHPFGRPATYRIADTIRHKYRTFF